MLDIPWYDPHWAISTSFSHTIQIYVHAGCPKSRCKKINCQDFYQRNIFLERSKSRRLLKTLKLKMYHFEFVQTKIKHNLEIQLYSIKNK